MLLLHPILINTQRAAARPDNHHSDLVGRTGGGDAASPKSVRARRPQAGCDRFHRGQAQSNANGTYGTDNTAVHIGGVSTETLAATVTASARTAGARSGRGPSTAAAVATSNTVSIVGKPSPLPLSTTASRAGGIEEGVKLRDGVRTTGTVHRDSTSSITLSGTTRARVGNAHGLGRAAEGPGHTSPIPAPTTAPQKGSIEDEVHLQDWALAPAAARPQAAAYLHTHARPTKDDKLLTTGSLGGAKPPLPLSTTALRQEGIEDRV